MIARGIPPLQRVPRALHRTRLHRLGGVLVATVVFAMSACGCSGPDGGAFPAPLPRPAGQRLLIKHGWDAPRAQFVHDHIATMEEQGFDGVAISLGPFWDRVQSQTPISADSLMAELAPLAQTPLRTLTHNFVITYSANAGSYFADYSVPLENFRILARVARGLGLTGIMIDSEDYGGTVQNWPEAAPGRTLAQAQQQAALRGGQIARAVAGEWPGATIVVLGGAWISEPATAEVFSGQIPWNDISQANELLGSFFVGLAAAAAESSVSVVDGGGIYTLRTPAQFELAYGWMKEGLAEQSSLVPDALRARWPSTVSVGFGVYDQPWLEQPMDAAIWESTLTAAMCRSDRWVWAYTERYDWWGGGWPVQPVPQEWVNATARARLRSLGCGDA